MATGFFFHEKYLEHDNGLFHPENPRRLQALLQGLRERDLWGKLTHVAPQPATEEQILLTHTKRHFEMIREAARRAPVQIDSDTRVSSASFDVAMLAAGAAVQGVSGIMDGKYKNAFAAARPPGHHATAEQAMGFCLFNNIAIAARYLVTKYHLKSVLIMDWDVHHGNGTQDIFYNDASVIYISLHKKHHYPGTGWEEERGAGNAEGTKINVPVGPPFDPVRYVKLFQKTLAQAESFSPEFVLISCGFDAHENDPLGNLALTSETYGRLTEILIEFCRQFGHERIFSILEGGYDYSALAEAGGIHIQKLLES